MPDEFKKELEQLINKFSKENGSNTPDFILAEYLANCLFIFDTAVNRREIWFGHEPKFGEPHRGDSEKFRQAKINQLETKRHEKSV